MIEMEYKDTRAEPFRLATGNHKGFWYYVLSLGTHPCAYVDVTGLSKCGLNPNRIDCHGGITYSDKQLKTVDKTGWFIGWDYAHCYDYSGCMPEILNAGTKRWTTAEIIAECKNVIDQLVKMAKLPELRG